MKISRKYTAKDHGGIMPASRVRFIVLHHTGGREGGDIPALTRRDSRITSSHFYITQEGEVYQLLNMNVVGYHVGESRYAGVVGLNKCSIGIELENLGDGKDKYTVRQLEQLDALIAYIDRSFGRKLKIVGHKEVCWPRGRKIDPSNNFPLNSYKTYRRHSQPAKVAKPKPPVFETKAPAKPAPKPAAVVAPKPVSKPAPKKKPCHDPNKMQILHRGAKGSAVEHLQRDLKRHGSRITVDGDFGPSTQSAVKKFQSKKKLKDDGIVGPATWKALL